MQLCLDDQISKTFKAVGAVSNVSARATSREHLKQLLTQDERYVFTLIQKFQTTGGEAYPKLSDRSDIIVITDEAHRSQYDIFALNMRSALPNAGFLGFTGTPLIEGEEERTREVFGDYVSVYDFARSVEDGATVSLFRLAVDQFYRWSPAAPIEIGDHAHGAHGATEQGRCAECRIAMEFLSCCGVTRTDRDAHRP
jgi:type I site-specific restriction-modification system R (restriction) subunit